MIRSRAYCGEYPNQISPSHERGVLLVMNMGGLEGENDMSNLICTFSFLLRSTRLVARFGASCPHLLDCISAWKARQASPKNPSPHVLLALPFRPGDLAWGTGFGVLDRCLRANLTDHLALA